nr:galactokinase family protein [Candidatus Sigynarchaeota archaeon]
MDFESFFGKDRVIEQAEAPGRLDVMGGIADYSGSLVLEMPVNRATRASIAIRQDDQVNVHSTNAEVMGKQATVTVHLGDFIDKSGAVDYMLVRQKLNRMLGSDWAAYVIGCLLILIKEKNVKATGMDAWISSDLPSGRGVSASAALEVSTMTALTRAIGITLDRIELPVLCQKVENYVVGAPCGLMDQLTSYLGEKDRLLPILCQPSDVRPSIAIPKGIQFVGIDSGAEHSIGGSSYTNVRVAAFMGYSIIAQAEGVSIEIIKTARTNRAWSKLPFQGYLANITGSTYEGKYKALLPEKMRGKDFIKQFGGTIDPVTEIKPDVEYTIQVCTQHPILENSRVHEFARILESMAKKKTISSEERLSLLKNLGDLMLQSHRSYGLCGLGHLETDAIVDAVIKAGPGAGVFGAKITGGGSGGTVSVLCSGQEGLRTAMEIAQNHWRAKGKDPVVFTGSMDGAMASAARKQ